ncbi:hypothetical protein Tco_1120811, partial [Tanacetum coccineum]
GWNNIGICNVPQINFWFFFSDVFFIWTSSSKDVNAVGKQVNTASPDLNTGSLKLNVVGSSVSKSK